MTPTSYLPEELWSLITGFAPKASLPALALCSKLFHHLTIPLLYRFVFYNVDRFPESQEREFFQQWRTSIAHVAVTSSTPYEPCVIVNFTAFLRTVNSSATLRSLIEVLGLDLGHQYFTNAEDDTTVRNLGNILPSLQLLYLVPGEDQVISLHGMRLTSLALGDFEWDVYKPETDYLYTIFSIGTLRHLTIANIRSWGNTEFGVDKTRHFTSAVSELFLTNSVPIGPDLIEVLHWPKALEVFHLEILPDWLATYGRRTNILSPGSVVNALEPQRESLRKFTINGGPDKRDMDNTTLEGLRGFPHIKRLNIPKICVLVSQVNDGDWRLKANQNPPQIGDILQHSLEELWLELSEVHSGLHALDELESSEASIMIGEIVDLLLDLALSKASMYPHLKEVMVWRGCELWQICKQRFHLKSSDYFYNDTDVPEAFLRDSNLFSLYEENGLRLHFLDHPQMSLSKQCV